MATFHSLAALPSRPPQERLYSPHLPLNAELQRCSCKLRLGRSGEIAWNASDKHDVARVVDHAIDVVAKKLSARIEVSATIETRPRSLAKLAEAHVNLRALVEPLCRSKCRLVALSPAGHCRRVLKGRYSLNR
jgi:hypothetical protein